jgi:predicted phage tail protein
MVDHANNISTVLRPSPFSMRAIPHVAAPGQSLEDILRNFPELPPEVWTHGIVRVGGIEVPREYWSRVKPKPGSKHLVHIGVHVADGGGGKSIFATIAAIALIIAVTAISGGILGPTGALSISSTLFAAGSTSAALAAAGVSIVGALALSALTPTAAAAPGPESDNSGKANLGAASIQGNVLAPFDAIPFVAGTHRVSPPHLIPPWSESVNDDQYVYAIVGLNGAHLLEDIRINGAPIGDFAGVEYEVRDVVTDDTDITLITSQVFENQIGITVAGHKLNDDAGDELQDIETPENSYPVWSGTRSRKDPDEIWLAFVWSALVAQEDAGAERAGIPIRIRIRREGDTEWINLPEFHAQRERLDAFRGTIKLRFQAATTALTRLDQDVTRPPWAYALYLEDADNDESFDVHSYFDLTANNNADNVGSEDGVAVIWLDPATFPVGYYDVQVKRGYGYLAQDFTVSTYVYDSAIPYFFSHTPASSPPSIRRDQTKIASAMSFVSLSSMWDEYPLREKGLSLIVVKAKNVSISSLSVLATGYANIWDGTDWDTFEPTRNPAAWWRYLAFGAQSNRPIFIEAQLDDESLQEWYDYCGDRRTLGASFDGTNDYLTRDGGLTGAADSKQFTFSLMLYRSNDDAVILGASSSLAGAEDRFRIVIDADGLLNIIATNAAGTTILDVETSFLISIDQWTHIVGSFDLADTADRHLYVNDNDQLVVTTYTNDTIDFTLADWAIGAAPDGSNKLEGAIADFWFEDGLYIDLSDESNRRKFLSEFKRPVNLGADGSIPTTTSPILFMSGAIGSWETNKGTGEGFTEVGEITEATVYGSGNNPNYECNAFFNTGQSLANVLRIVAATGRASARMSDKIGVIIDDDRSAESPIQLFTQRNARGLSVRRAFPRIPDGFRIGFNDETKDYLPEEIFVYRNVINPTTIESINYIGITSRTQALDRANLDFNQLLRRGRLYTLEVDIENLYCVKGSLVYLVYDVLSRQYDAARIVSVTTSMGNVTGLTLDTPLRLTLIGDKGGSYPAGVVIQLKDGTTIVEEIDEETDSATITFSTPFTEPAGSILDEHCLVACGSLATVEKRMLVLSIAPQDDYTASITLVDVADPIPILAPGPLDVNSPDGEQIFAPY